MATQHMSFFSVEQGNFMKLNYYSGELTKILVYAWYDFLTPM